MRLWQLSDRQTGELLFAILIFLGVFSIYVADRDVIMRTDSAWTLHVAMSLVRAGDTNLDEFRNLIDDGSSYTILPVNDHLHYYFPIGTPLLIAPAMLLLDRFALSLWSFDLYAHMLNNQLDALLGSIELVLACTIVASSAAIVYLLGRHLLSRWRSLILVIVFAFCTPAWSTASRALWQHGPSMLMLLLALLFVVRAREDAGQIRFAGLFLAAAYVVRPTNAIPILVLTIYVLLTYPRRLPHFVLWAIPVASAFLAYNVLTYGAILPPYYQPGRLASNPNFMEALWGNLISPARGLFVYSPVFLLCAMGLFLRLQKRTFSRLDVSVLVIIFLHWLMISSFFHWWGGYSYGPRLFTDMVPFLLYLTVPVIATLSVPPAWKPRIRPRVAGPVAPSLLTAIFVLLAGVSFFMHFRGATQLAAWRWNWPFEEFVADVDADAARLWDWSDPQFWRGLRRGKLEATPGYHYVQVASKQDVQELSIRLYNVGDRPLHWRALAPSAINFVSHTAPDDLHIATSTAPGSGPILGQSVSELAIKFDTRHYAGGLQSLGGVLIQALDNSGALADQAPFVVPVTASVPHHANDNGAAPALNSGDGRGNLFLPLLFQSNERTYPPDILINGQAQYEVAIDLRALFGAGWYTMEHNESGHWRWAASPSVLLIRSDKLRHIGARLMPAALNAIGSDNGAGDAGEMRITLNGNSLHAREAPAVPLQVGDSAEIGLELVEGWNVVTLELAAGNFRPSEVNPETGDGRLLSFALSEVNLLVE